MPSPSSPAPTSSSVPGSGTGVNWKGDSTKPVLETPVLFEGSPGASFVASDANSPSVLAMLPNLDSIENVNTEGHTSEQQGGSAVVRILNMVTFGTLIESPKGGLITAGVDPWA